MVSYEAQGWIKANAAVVDQKHTYVPVTWFKMDTSVAEKEEESIEVKGSISSSS